MVDQVGAHVTDSADAPVRPAAPVERVVDRVIFDARADAEKKIPRQLVWNRVVACHSSGESGIHARAVPAKSIGWFFERLGARHALRPEAKRAVGPDVDLAD